MIARNESEVIVRTDIDRRLADDRDSVVRAKTLESTQESEI